MLHNGMASIKFISNFGQWTVIPLLTLIRPTLFRVNAFKG